MLKFKKREVFLEQEIAFFCELSGTEMKSGGHAEINVNLYNCSMKTGIEIKLDRMVGRNKF